MPRSMSTLLQCILEQNPSIKATQTDPVLEYLYGARANYSSVPETKAMDKILAADTWKGFCWGGLSGYVKAYTDKPHICIKTRGATIHYSWFKSFMPYKPKMICMVRNLKSIISSMEKLFRKNSEHHQQIQNHTKMQGTSTFKRTQEWLSSPPVGLALERIYQSFLEKINNEVLYIRAEDLTQNPQEEMLKIYKYLELDFFIHDFNNIQQTIKEDDSVYGLTIDIHAIKKEIEPVKDDYEEILGKSTCDWIDNNFTGYQKQFNFI